MEKEALNRASFPLQLQAQLPQMAEEMGFVPSVAQGERNKVERYVISMHHFRSHNATSKNEAKKGPTQSVSSFFATQ